jgi:hypothetical protein
MIKNFFACLTCLAVILNIAMAQKVQEYTQEYTLDQNGVRHDNSPLKLPTGTSIRIKVKNVNPYKLSGTGILSSYNLVFDIPQSFTSVIDSQSPNADNLDSLNQRLDSLYEEKNKKDSILTNDRNMANTKSPRTKGQTAKLNKEIKVLEEDTANVNKAIKELEAQIAALLKKANDIKREDSIKKAFVQDYNSTVASLHKIYALQSITKYVDSINNILFIQDTAIFKTSLRNYLNLVLNKENATINDVSKHFNTALQEFNTHYIDLANSYTALNKELAKQMVDLDVTIIDKESKKDVKTTVSIPIDRKKIFEAEFANISKFNAKFQDPVYTANLKNNLNDGISTLNNLLSSNFEITLPLGKDVTPITADEVTIEPQLKNSKQELVKSFPSFTVSTYGNWKVNLSAGYLISFINEDNYTVRTDASGNSIGIAKSNTNTTSHGLGTLIHAYKTLKTAVNYGGCIGFGLPLNNQDISFYFGPSLLINESKNRVVLSAGISLTKVQKINMANIKEGSLDFIGNTNQKQPLYDKVFKPSVFVGLTFNFANLK